MTIYTIEFKNWKSEHAVLTDTAESICWDGIKWCTCTVFVELIVIAFILFVSLSCVIRDIDVSAIIDKLSLWYEMSQNTENVWSERGKENSYCGITIDFKIEMFGFWFTQFRRCHWFCYTVKQSNINTFLLEDEAKM